MILTNMRLAGFVCVAVSLFGCTDGQSSSDDQEPSATTANCEHQFAALRAEVDQPQEVDESIRELWASRLAGSTKVFQSIIQNGEWDCFQQLLSSVNSGGDAWDFAVLFGAPQFTMPIFDRFERWKIPESADLGMSADAFHDARLLAAKYVALQFGSGSEEWRSQYYHAMLWSRLVRIHTQAGFAKYVDETVKGFETAPDEEQWWYVRIALILMYSTGELPEWQHIEPAKVRKAFDEWVARTKQYYETLSPTSDGLHWKDGGTMSRLQEEKGLNGALDSPFEDWHDAVPPAAVIDDQYSRSLF